MIEETNKNPLKQVLDLWDIDSIIDSTEPGKELIKIPTLHAKYVRIMMRNIILSKELEQQLLALRKLKWDYYNGRLTQEELEKYGWKQFKFILKSEIKDYIEADNDVLKIMTQKTLHDEVVSCCQSILKELQSRTYQLRSYIDWEKTIMGQ